MNKNKYKKYILLSAIFVSLGFAFLPVFAHAQNYTLLEQIPGTTGTSGDLIAYMKSIYKFAIWAVGIAALFMIMLGGIMYIGSAGNAAAAGKAKGIITDAVIGLIMALSAYLILYEINPSLLTITAPKDMSLAGNNTGTSSASSNPSQTAQNQADCDKYCNGGGMGDGTSVDTCKSNCMAAKSAQQTQQSATTGNPSGTKVSGGSCSQIDDACNSNTSGVDPKLLKAVMVGGEGCNKSVSSDGYGSCGYSQALPAIRTKCGISGTAAESCAAIQNDPQLDANCAAWLINDNAKRCGMDVAGVASCYNSGKPNNCPKTTKNYCGRVQDSYNNM